MDIQEIKKQLPNGAGRKIAEMCNVNYDTVQRFLRGKSTKSDLVIMKSTAKFLKEYKEAKANATQELQSVANA